MVTDLGRNCRLCGVDALETAFELPAAPSNVSHLLSDAELPRDRAVHLTVLRCTACGFVQLAQAQSDDFYDDYLMTRSHSARMREYETALAGEFVERYQLRGRRVVDLGCGDGQYLRMLAAAGAEPSGVEPSAAFREEAVRTGFPCHRGYIGRTTPAPGAPYAAFVTRQVLEHVPDPVDFLLGARASLQPDEVGLIEVPSLEQAIEHGRFFDFFPDHLNYFGVRTLRMILELTGFDVEEVRRDMDDEYLVALVRVRRSDDVRSLHDAAHETASELRAFLEAERAAGRRVALWGAGGKGVTAVAASGVADVAYVVDSDPHKHGRYLPVSHLRVEPPAMLQREPVDTVVLTALAFKNEILRQLRDEIGFRGKIVVLAQPLQTVAQ